MKTSTSIFLSLFTLFLIITSCSSDDNSENITHPEGKTYIPDDNFEQALIDLEYDDVLDDYVLTENISGITSLDLLNKSISDLTGIEDFVNLTFLDLQNNQLTSIDISSNTNLITFYCYNNQLTSLDVSNNPNLNYIWCSGNPLPSLDVSNNINLITLECQGNQFTSLDLRNNINLRTLWCTDNQLTDLDLSSNIDLRDIWCSNNLFTSLDVTNNTNLTNSLRCEGNQITTIIIAPVHDLYKDDWYTDPGVTFIY